MRAIFIIIGVLHYCESVNMSSWTIVAPSARSLLWLIYLHDGKHNIRRPGQQPGHLGGRAGVRPPIYALLLFIWRPGQQPGHPGEAGQGPGHLPLLLFLWPARLVLSFIIAGRIIFLVAHLTSRQPYGGSLGKSACPGFPGGSTYAESTRYGGYGMEVASQAARRWSYTVICSEAITM